EQVALTDDELGDAAQWLMPGLTLEVEFYNGTPIGVELPGSMELTVVETEPPLKGATASNSNKPAKLENGVTLQVPPFIVEGETKAAEPLAKRIKLDHPGLSLVVSTTTKTGHKVAQESLKGVADLVFYFPFDWRSTVRRSLRHIRPSVVLLMETEIWFNFFRE